MSTYKTFSLYLEEYCDGCRYFEADIEKIRYNEYLLFAVFSDKERRDEIRPERGVAGYRDYQRILAR